MNTILIVDDDMIGRFTVESILEGEGYQLVMAENGKDALQKARQSPPDIILLDVMMPEMNGYEVCREIQKDPALSQIPVIFLTALDDRPALLEGLSAGSNDFMTKPCDRFELRARLRGLLSQKRPYIP